MGLRYRTTVDFIGLFVTVVLMFDIYMHVYNIFHSHLYYVLWVGGGGSRFLPQN